MNKSLILFVVSWALANATANSVDSLNGAWIEESIRWNNIRADINPHGQWAQARILYLGNDRKFGIIECTVTRHHGKNDMKISRGDPRGVYKGESVANGKTITTTYQLVEATVSPVGPLGEQMPRPIKNSTIEISSDGALIFEGKTFRRVKVLDKNALEILSESPSPSF